MIRLFLRICIVAGIAGLSAQAAPWPPTLDTKCPLTKSVDGRAIEHYWHGPRDSWGYPPGGPDDWAFHPALESAGNQNHNTFYVLWPKHPRENAPLCVVLHSANRTGYDYLGYTALSRKVSPGDLPGPPSGGPLDDFYVLYLNTTNAEWWGWTEENQNFPKHIDTPPAAERRVLDTVEWAIERYKIDRNRVYLGGMSMGGCGGLGIGFTHGDIFAAMRLFAPAGTGYVSDRVGGLDGPPPGASLADRDAWLKRVSFVGLPDPPVLVDSSSQTDGWSSTQPALVHAAQTGHLPLVLTWGPYGHEGSDVKISQYPLCAVAMAYPWLDIHKNEAYPVFTHASADQQCPWLTPAKFDETGQLNAWFRWKAEQDTPSDFSMQLWIAHPAIKNPPPAMPDSATADVTLRRLQQFKVHCGQSYSWQLSTAGKVIASGTATPDIADLLTIPHLPVSTTPAELSIK